ncbi:Hypothetical protein GLP15_5172 [Giardia lamblia P15]|uniref:Uncharacterized protein n=1 Tax=Giardia intestinalis (strain P15) TaxID=658858 RepID=E1EWA4_GIAIA|nr:Hypothetical protein GLP15_5172 [Giardia lamblia P15]
MGIVLALVLLCTVISDFSSCFADNSTLQIDLQNNAFVLRLWKKTSQTSKQTMKNLVHYALDEFYTSTDNECLVYSKGFNATLRNEYLSMKTVYNSAPEDEITLTFLCPFDEFTCRGLAAEIVSFKYTLSVYFSDTTIEISKNVKTVTIISYDHSACWSDPYIMYNINADYDPTYLCVVALPCACDFPTSLPISFSAAFISVKANNSQTLLTTLPVTPVDTDSSDIKDKVGKLPIDLLFSTSYVHSSTSYFCCICDLLPTADEQKNCTLQIATISQNVDLSAILSYRASYSSSDISVSTTIYTSTSAYTTARYSNCFLDPQVWLYPNAVQIQLTPSPLRDSENCRNPIGLSSTYMRIDLLNTNNYTQVVTQEVPLQAFSWEKQTYWLFCETDACYEILQAAQSNLIRLQVMQYISFLSDSKDILDTVIIAAPNQNITCLNEVQISLSERSLKVLFTLNTRSCLPLQDTLSQRAFYRVAFYESSSANVATQNFTMKGRMTHVIKDYTVGQEVPMTCANIDVSYTSMTCNEFFSWMRKAAKKKTLVATIIYGDFIYTITKIYYDGSGFLIGLTVSLTALIAIGASIYTYLSVRRFMRVINKLAL